jgi:hypothetical protein
VLRGEVEAVNAQPAGGVRRRVDASTTAQHAAAQGHPHARHARPALPAVPAPPSGARLAALPTDDAGLLARAQAHPEWAFPRGGQLAQAHNAHYADTRSQLAYALENDYNSIECDVRLRSGVPVLAHDSSAPSDLTFEAWARALAASGRMARIDLMEASAIPAVLEIVDRLGIPHDRITFNVSVDAPWSPANVSVARLKELRARYPEAWITMNMPLPTRIGTWLLARAGRAIGGKVAGTLTDPLVSAALVHSLQKGAAVDVWNEPRVWQPADVAAEEQRLRALGVDGMVDLRRRDDPLARPSSEPGSAAAAAAAG